LGAGPGKELPDFRHSIGYRSHVDRAQVYATLAAGNRDGVARTPFDQSMAFRQVPQLKVNHPQIHWWLRFAYRKIAPIGSDADTTLTDSLAKVCHFIFNRSLIIDDIGFWAINNKGRLKIIRNKKMYFLMV
jgi:hypothetical protein